MAAAAKFHIDVDIHDLLNNSNQRPPAPAESGGLTLPDPVYPQHLDRIGMAGPEIAPEKRVWGIDDIFRLVLTEMTAARQERNPRVAAAGRPQGPDLDVPGWTVQPHFGPGGCAPPGIAIAIAAAR